MEDEWKSTTGDVFRFEAEGDSIEGTLAATRDGNYFRPAGGKSQVYDIKTKDGIKSVFGSMVLERQMQSVKVGDKVKIVYKGTVQTKQGRQAKNYEVFTK
jgi:hypothetical protein